MPRLSEEQKQSWEGEIFVEEITAILNSFENNKSPGNDGIQCTNRILQNLLGIN